MISTPLRAWRHLPVVIALLLSACDGTPRDHARHACEVRHQGCAELLFEFDDETGQTTYCRCVDDETGANSNLPPGEYERTSTGVKRAPAAIEWDVDPFTAAERACETLCLYLPGNFSERAGENVTCRCPEEEPAPTPTGQTERGTFGCSTGEEIHSRRCWYDSSRNSYVEWDPSGEVAP